MKNICQAVRVLIGIAFAVYRIKQPGTIDWRERAGHDIRIGAHIDECGEKTDTAVCVNQQKLCFMGIDIVSRGRTEMSLKAVGKGQQRVGIHGNDVLGLQGGEVDDLVLCERIVPV